MFDEARYHAEMDQLLDAAVAALRRDHPQLVVYTVSIWTDPDAAASAVSIDTVEHSTACLADAAAYDARYYAKYLADGDLEQARLFALRTPGERGRATNPADFALRNLATIDHRAFPEDWGAESEGAWWDVLESALAQVLARALARFAAVPLHADAELGVNGRDDWYQSAQPLRPGGAG
jgi:hypothetical protein